MFFLGLREDEGLGIGLDGYKERNAVDARLTNRMGDKDDDDDDSDGLEGRWLDG